MSVLDPAPTRSPATMGWATVGLAGAAVAVLAVGALHVLAADTVDPVRRTISEYALGPQGWLFDAGVLAFAAGAAAVLVAAVRAGLVRATAPSAVLYASGVLGLLLVVAFEKTNWAVGPSVGGSVHRYASLLVFVALPLAVLLVAWRARRWTVVSPAALTLAGMLTIVAAIPLAPFVGVPWWRVLPLGLMERGIAAMLATSVVALGVWTLRAAVPGPVVAPEPIVA